MVEKGGTNMKPGPKTVEEFASFALFALVLLLLWAVSRFLMG